MNKRIYETGIILLLILLAAVGPNSFVVAEAGYGSFSEIAIKFLLPSIVLIIIIIGLLGIFTKSLARQSLNGLFAGIIATIGLEIIREAGFRMGMMPGDLPKLMGVLLLNRFALGPDRASNLAGWSYHFYNGAAFGMIYSLLVGKGKVWIGMVYGFLIGVAFMISPVTRSLGIGPFGTEFKHGYEFALTVTLAHVSYGLLLGWLVAKRNSGKPNIIGRLREPVFAI